MKKILILGNSPAAVGVIEMVRSHDPSSSIRLWALDECAPFDRNQVPLWISGEKNKNQLLVKPISFYEENHVELILNKNLERLQLMKRTLLADDKQRYEFDFLILTDGPSSKWPSVKGRQKSGVYSLRKWTEVRQLMDQWSLTDTVIIQSSRREGETLALSIRQKGKDVLWVIPEAQAPKDDTGQGNPFPYREALMGRQGIHLISGQEITEVLGNGDVMAVRLSSGKVMACQMVIFVDCSADLKFLQDTPLATQDKIPVKENFQTQLDFVFACDDIAQLPSLPKSHTETFSLTELIHQGKVIGTHIVGGQQQSLPTALTQADL